MSWPTTALLLLLPLCAQAVYLPRAPPSRATIRQIVQFPNRTWIENLAVRPNGKLLVTLFSSPSLYQIDPPQPSPTPSLVANFPSALGTLGITELSDPDTFAITKGNFSEATGSVDPASYSVWKADLRKSTPAISPIANLPNASILNGLTTTRSPPKSNVLITADSIAGVLWRVDAATGKYELLLNSTATQPAAPYPLGWGANGVHVQNGVLYFTNTDKGLYRVAVGEDGQIKGKVELVSGFLGGDDFAFAGQRGEVVVANGAGIVQKVTAKGEVVQVEVEGGDLLVGITAVAFGRTERDKKTLYVVTNGGWSGVPEGVEQVGGRVLAIDLGRWV